jgi:hypothetical protein
MANHIAINTTSAGIPQQLQATQPLALEQHSHHWRHAHTYLNNTSMASIHAFNTLVIHITAMHPPPELHSHHRSYAATAGAMQSPPELHSHHRRFQSYHFYYHSSTFNTLLTHAIAIQPPPELHSHW